MAQALESELIPIMRAEYVADSPLLDRVLALLLRLTDRFTGASFQGQTERLARSTLSMAESESTAAFVKSVNRAVGVDMSRVMGGMQDYLDITVAENVGLIKSIGSDYFSGIERIVLGGMRAGESNTVIARKIQKETGAAYRRAKTIARDQMSKVNTDVARYRQKEAGIKRFRWSTAKDQRVSGNPAGRYPNAKMKCYMIARQDIGFGAGVYLINKGASYAGESGLFPGRSHVNCRCVMVSLIEGVDY